MATGRPIRVINLPLRGMILREMNLSPDGRTLSAAAVANSPSGWSAWAWDLLGRINLAWKPPMQTDLVLVDLATGQVLARAPGASFAEFSPDGRTVLTGRGARGQFAIRAAPQP